jgi:hypothetical protein
LLEETPLLGGVSQDLVSVPKMATLGHHFRGEKDFEILHGEELVVGGIRLLKQSGAPKWFWELTRPAFRWIKMASMWLSWTWLLKQSGAPKWFWELTRPAFRWIKMANMWLSWTWGECSLPRKWKNKGNGVPVSFGAILTNGVPVIHQWSAWDLVSMAKTPLWDLVSMAKTPLNPHQSSLCECM